MDTKSKNKRQWRQSLLRTIGIFVASLFVALLIMMQDEPWAQWAWILSCWVSILTFAAIPLLFLNYLSGDDFPETGRFFKGAPWAVVGGVTSFGAMVLLTQSSCCYKGNMYMLACFGPMIGLMGFGIGGYLQNHFPLLIVTFAAPFVGGYMQPYVGKDFATIFVLVFSFVPLGISIYLRMTRGVPGEAFPPTQTIIWQQARCPQCDGSWTLGKWGTEDEERCPTCDWSWKEAGISPFDVPSFLVSELPKRNSKQK